MISSRRIFYVIALFILITGCTPRATPVPTATPLPTATLPPTLTPTPTPVPNCPAANPTISWTAPADFNGYPQAIQNYLNAGGAGEALKVLLRNASSINDQYGGVYLFDLTGDGDPETIVSILDPFSEQPIPGGMLLVYSCAARQVNLIYSDVESDPQPMTQIVKVDDLIGAKRGGQLATLSSSCGAHTCFDTLDVLGWNGQTLISLMSAPLSMPSAAFAFNRPAGESAYQIEVQGGTINSIGAGPQRVERQIWKWNGAQYVQVSAELSPVEYRIHAVYEGDDAFKAGDYAQAIDWYSRVITDDSLKDWQVEAGFVKPHDRETLTAYARFRLLLIGLLRGDANARDQLDRLTADFPDGSPAHDTQQLALAFWNKYQEAQDIKAACAVADAYANDQYQIVDDLNLFGYANRTYTSDDICPIR